MQNEHWIPATEYCGPCSATSHFQYVIKTENFDCEFNQMLLVTNNQELDRDDDEGVWVNKSPPTDTSLFYRFYSTLTSQQLDRLLEKYQYDCLFYEYPCKDMVDKIKLFKNMNPTYKHQYEDTC